jgi:hypothetical protein
MCLRCIQHSKTDKTWKDQPGSGVDMEMLKYTAFWLSITVPQVTPPLEDLQYIYQASPPASQASTPPSHLEAPSIFT